MTIEQMRELYNARPFRPFVIHLADGRTCEVLHNEFISFSRSGRILHFVTEQDTMDHIDLLMVGTVEELPEGRNGRRRKAS